MNASLSVTPFSSSQSQDKPTYAVVGAGVVGLCVALEAQRQGYQVTLLDGNEPGRAASFGNAGYLATEVIEPLATPATVRNAPKLWLNPDGPVCIPFKYLPKALPWYAKFLKAARPQQAMQGTQAISALNKRSQPAWLRTLLDIGQENLLVKAGNLVVWEDDRQKVAAHQLASKLQQHEVDCEVVEGQRLAELEPELSLKLSHAVYVPEIYRLSDPYEVCQALFQAFIERGGHFINEKVMSLQASTHNIEVHIPGHRHQFGHVSLCAGAWTQTLLEQVGITVPLEAERGYHLTFPKNQSRIRHTILSADRRFVMSPLDSGLRVVGMSEIGGTELPPIEKRFSVLRKHTKALLPKLFGPEDAQSSEWMGHRPTLPDSLPVIDQHPKFPRLSFAFGHQHLGVTQAAITAELLLQKVDKRPTSVALRPYRVDRF
ncbi:NAD(P)/FAD-dependent oxidoreductase [Marinomonas ostreistagni]|uniref:FAD-binding oxidoreductase n=1 Tax=Marinomonas ostreistagni TaxID=359209 RepID=A0ABS0Z9K9_9GAMM|nr:FAD-binding oxidoreductase [Marinomonas ostreistagni]MBJ7550344.1 FAD-binding oxidoreductase [Marinomonas ostreistagni]